MLWPSWQQDNLYDAYWAWVFVIDDTLRLFIAKTRLATDQTAWAVCVLSAHEGRTNVQVDPNRTM